jgi:hypothetical protein
MEKPQRAEYRITFTLDGVHRVVRVEACEIETAVAVFRSDPDEDRGCADVLLIEKIHEGEIVHALR